MEKPKTVTFLAVADDGFRCEACHIYVEKVPHYCPSCGLPTTNFDDQRIKAADDAYGQWLNMIHDEG